MVDSAPERSFIGQLRLSQTWAMLVAAVFLVSVPVFVQAPLVRWFPELSLLLTGGWLGLSLILMARDRTQLWGDLLFGFTWSWLAGSIYWGWFRWEPLLHLPIEAIGLPVAIWCLVRQWGKVGNFFYLGSLFGTVVTDLYFYIVDLIPHWWAFGGAVLSTILVDGLFWLVASAA